MSLSFDPARHLYLDGKQELTSVTTLLGMTGAAKDLSFLDLDPIYRARGTAVHQIMELVGRGDYEESETDPELVPYGREIAKWIADTGFRGRVWELPMANRKLRIAGTLDVGGECGDEIWLVDAKTGTLQEPGVCYQLAGYQDLLLTGEVIEDAVGEYDQDWIQYVRVNPSKIRRKSLNLKAGGPYTFRSHDEVRWPGAWRSEVTHFHIFNEYGLLKKKERAA
jgi:hypothetical protein